MSNYLTLLTISIAGHIVSLPAFIEMEKRISTIFALGHRAFKYFWVNFVAGLLFGCLYIWLGLANAMVAHFVADISLRLLVSSKIQLTLLQFEISSWLTKNVWD